MGITTVVVDDGKYTISFGHTEGDFMRLLRHGEYWPGGEGLKHAGVVLALAQRIAELEPRLTTAESALTVTRKLLAAYERGEVPPADPKMPYYVDQAWLDAAPEFNALGVRVQQAGVLTDEQIIQVFKEENVDWWPTDSEFIKFARAILAAAGVKP